MTIDGSAFIARFHPFDPAFTPPLHFRQFHEVNLGEAIYYVHSHTLVLSESDYKQSEMDAVSVVAALHHIMTVDVGGEK